MQADRTLDRTGGGLGLGLALVKGLVDLHEGDVRAHSIGRQFQHTVGKKVVWSARPTKQ